MAGNSPNLSDYGCPYTGYLNICFGYKMQCENETHYIISEEYKAIKLNDAIRTECKGAVDFGDTELLRN